MDNDMLKLSTYGTTYTLLFSAKGSISTSSQKSLVAKNRPNQIESGLNVQLSGQ
jgi:hypothetical protein